MSDEDSKRQDKFEASIRRLIRFADENRNYVVGGVVALLLVVGAIYFKVSSGTREERTAWEGLSKAESPAILRDRWKKHKHTGAGFFLAQEFALRLWGEQEVLADKDEDGVNDARILLLDEGIAVLTEALEIHGRHPMTAHMERLRGTLQAERGWVQEHGAAILAARKPAPRKGSPKKEKLAPVKRVPDEAGRLPRVTLHTDRGVIVVELFEDEAPNHVANLVALALEGFYDDLVFHRVEDWVTQTGCPDGTGMGGPGHRIAAEFNEHKHDRGAFGMARSNEENSAGSQFYFVKKPQHNIDGQYTIFGKVVEGMDVVDRIQKNDRLNKIEVNVLRDKEYVPDVIQTE
jgi:cyclophilin family peptidyl-prolyl cis-trans isomerase